MAQNKWTPEQLDAITDNGRNLLVAAAAGSGKTAVLVERIIKKITDRKNPVDIDKLLVVTFTNAAAAEMRERLANAITDKLSENPADKNLHKQLTLLNKASITTIHSFCLEVIRNNYTATDLDPAFTIIDDAETKMLRQDALESVFAKKYENEDENTDENFINLLEGFGYGRSDGKLHEKVLQVYEFTRSFPWPKEWMIEVLSQYRKSKDVTGFEELIWGNKLITYAKTIIEAALGTAYFIKDLVVGADGFNGYDLTADDDITILENIADNLNGSWDAAYEAVSFSKVARLKPCSKNADNNTKDEFKMGRDMVKSIIDKLKKEVFVASSEVILNEINLMAPVIEMLLQLVKEFSTEYANKKIEKNGVDFSDLEHFALSVLTDNENRNSPSLIAENYRNKFVEVLIDEYQDSNLIQETILTTVSRQGTSEPNMFMVGDLKQSIYKFRLAMPEIFMGKYKSFSDMKDSNERKIKLFNNFRSREPIISGVNYIFKQIMTDEVGELDYNDDEALKTGLDYPDCDESTEYCGGSTEIIIVDTFIPKEDEEQSQGQYEMTGQVQENIQQQEQEDDEVPDSITAEARAIGKRINELMSPDENGKTFVVYNKDENAYNPLKFRDIVILMRSPGNRSEIFTKELANMGIPVYADVGEAFFKSLETMTILALLQVLDNPLCDIPLISVLLSPIGGFNAEELVVIRKDDKKSAFYNTLQTKAKLTEETNTLAVKCSEFIEKINKWRKMSTYMQIDNLIWLIYNESSYFAIVGAYPGGKLRQANLKMLFEKAGQYEKSTFKGLFNFMNYMEKVRTGNIDLGSAKILGENEDVVRIMSIHKSKGLEFPVVFLAGCGKKFNMTDLSQEIMLHRDLGIGSDFVNVEKRLRYTTPVKEAIKFSLKVETISEEMRILYTGMTRAREKLIITGTIRDVSKKALKWRKNLIKCDSKLLPYFMLESGTYFDFICSSIMRHHEGDCLRVFVNLESSSYIKDLSKWNIKITNISELTGYTGLVANILNKLEDTLTHISIPFKDAISDGKPHFVLNEKQLGEIYKRLDYIYPYEKNLLPSKITVTELKRKYAEVENEDTHTFKPGSLKKPHFIEGERGFTAAEKGTIVHFVMQHIDIFSVLTIDDVHSYIVKMIDQSLLTEDEAATVDRAMIYEFIKSPVCKRIMSAGNLQREIPFSINLDVGELTGNDKYLKSDVLLQGIIDCYFIENDEIVILDYKTDYVKNGDEESIKERYSLQLKCYKKALEIITGKVVRNTYMYLFSTGNLVEF